jgi:2-oxoglutarate dehydrogenase E2 component (dihydrolipoamide succinyltransferase)
MAKIEISLPAMGEGVTDATITRWLKKEGEKIEEDESLVEVATDKVDSEIPSPETGIIEKIVLQEGSVVAVGQVLAIINTQAEEVKKEAIVYEKQPLVEIKKPQNEVITSSNTLEGKLPANTPNGKFLTPLVRSIAEKEGLTLNELEKISGSGAENRITKEDILSYLQQKIKLKATAEKVPTQQQEVKEIPVTEIAKTSTPAISIAQKPVSKGDNYEIITMDRMRKLIAEHMVYSKHISPHVTSFIEADVTNLVLWREAAKKDFLIRYNEKLTFTPFFVEAVAKALRDFPNVNVSVDGDTIILKKNINIGMATALPSGNLIVPVIKNADTLNITGLTKAVNDLAARARNNKLKPEEIQGGTFTITNFGTFDNLSGTPIINQPEVAILGIGAIKKRPVVIETSAGDAIAIRHIVILSLSYDHRVVDGALGGMFLKQIAKNLENFHSNINI